MSDSSFVINRRPSTQDVSWFLDLHAVEQLDLNPPYQRRSVWGTKDRRYFLDTIFRGFPCPPIYLHKIIRDGRSVYAVVDGKQRIETVLQFFGNKLSLPKSFGDRRLDGQKWKSVSQDPELASRFLNYVFPVEFVELPFNNTAYVNDIFDRLNRNSKILNRQELRHARYEGWAIKRAEEETNSEIWGKLKVVTKAKSKRMQDVQFLSELMLVVILKRIVGFDQDMLDQMYSTYDDLDEFDDSNEWGFPNIDVETFNQEFEDAKKSLECLVADDSIKNFLCDTKHLYSVWVYIVLSQDDNALTPVDVAKYKQLVEGCRIRAKGPDVPGYSECGKDVIRYYDASVGANTELPQRTDRQNALISILQA